MQTYYKIPTVFNRDSKNKKLIEGAWASPFLAYLQDSCWTFTEKVDGTNIRVAWDGYRVSFGGRTNNADIPAKAQMYLDDKFATPEAETLFEQTFGDKPAILFGECYGDNIQNGSKDYRPDIAFILFDVLIQSPDSPAGNIWFNRAAVESVAAAVGVDAVPILLTGTLKEGIEFIKSKPVSVVSQFENRVIEGIVGTPSVVLLDNQGKRISVKIKVADFT